jgi:hypothetical protein
LQEEIGQKDKQWPTKHYTQRKPKVEQHDLNEKHRENQRLSNTISTKNTTHREYQRLSNTISTKNTTHRENQRLNNTISTKNTEKTKG